MSECELPEGAVEVARITIVKTFDDNMPGGSGVFTHYSEGLSLLDALGMLAFATATTPDTYDCTCDDQEDA